GHVRRAPSIETQVNPVHSWNQVPASPNVLLETSCGSPSTGVRQHESAVMTLRSHVASAKRERTSLLRANECQLALVYTFTIRPEATPFAMARSDRNGLETGYPGLRR